MKIIVYKNLLGRYEIASIDDIDGEELIIKFENPIDAYLTLGSIAARVSRGVCRIRGDRLTDGRYSPRLYAGGREAELEGFTASSGEITRAGIDEKYVRSLAMRVNEIDGKMRELEEELNGVRARIDTKIKF